MRAFYSDQFVLPLPPEHRFLMNKYALLRQQVVATGLVAPDDLRVPDRATDEQILRAHDADYLERVKRGELTRQEIRRIGFPWSPEMVERSRRSSGGTMAGGYARNVEDIVSIHLQTVRIAVEMWRRWRD